ncbi:MAG: hypothetical protein LW699_05020 [Pirellula sp.]|jgi:hypothetical protein|nr:hypothetical protein [Pirellula sp.]
MRFSWLTGSMCFASSLAVVQGWCAEPSMLDVLRSCPKTANAIVQGDMVALRKLTLGSPLHEDLPGNVVRVRIAAELDLESFQPDWEIGYAAVEKTSTAESIAQREGGYVDTLQGRSIVWTPNEMYLVPLADNVVSIVRPADRKFVGQWLKKDRSNVVSSYLQQVAGRLTDRQSVSIAVDLEDVLSTGVLNEKLAQSKSLQGKNIESIAKSLSSVQGITISVASDALEATVLIDFLSAPTELTPVAKAFFAEVLTARGVQLDEFSQWKMSAVSEGKTLSFTGPIASETLDDLLGMFTVHRASRGVTTVTKTDSPSAPTAPQTSPSVVAENTRDYFRKVINIVHRVRDYSANNTGERAQWNGNMANRIDEMPTLEVDPQMVMFGAEVAKSLRSNSMSMQLTNISQGAAAVAADAGTGAFSTATAVGTMAGMGYGYGGYGNYGSYGGNFVDPNSPVKYYRMGQAQGNTSFKELMARLEQSLADMRRTMTEKYKIQF